MSEINRIASEFLREYMRNHDASAEFHRVIRPHERSEGRDFDETAAEFLAQVQSQGSVSSDRIDVSDTPSSFVILRVCSKKLPRFLAGTRKDGKEIWTFDARLAAAVPPDRAEEFVTALRSHGVETFTMPAPEPHSRSL